MPVVGIDLETAPKKTHLQMQTLDKALSSQAIVNG